MMASGGLSITVIDESSPTATDRCKGNRDGVFPPKQQDVIRIGFNNVNGFPVKRGSTKQNEMIHLLSSGQFENTHWRNANIHIKDITYGWFNKINIQSAYFQAYKFSSSFQVGGVSQWVLNELVSRVTGQGEDQSGAGRWVWQDISGSKGVRTRIYSAYCPVKNESSLGSTWNQQTTLGETFSNPIDKFIADLITEIEQCLELGLHILLMIDANDDVRTGTLARKAGKLGLKELISAQESPRGTQMRGSVPIDGIFGSQHFYNKDIHGGYSLGFSDHLCLWIDIPKAIFLGNIDTPNIFRCRRLQKSDPRTVKRYINAYKKKLRESHIFQTVQDLTNQRLPNNAMKDKWDEIDKIVLKARLSAEEKCRKLRMGKIQWTPDYAKWRISKKFWCLSLKRKSGGSVD
jgi:hypothetical protein